MLLNTSLNMLLHYTRLSCGPSVEGKFRLLWDSDFLSRNMAAGEVDKVESLVYADMCIDAK
jgi:hypothetical protein